MNLNLLLIVFICHLSQIIGLTHWMRNLGADLDLFTAQTFPPKKKSHAHFYQRTAKQVKKKDVVKN